MDSKEIRPEPVSDGKIKKRAFGMLFFAICAVYGALKLLPGIWINVVYWACRGYMEIRSALYPQEAYSIGIIGGADGPTAIFLTAPVWMHYAVPVAMLVAGICGFLWLRRKK